MDLSKRKEKKLIEIIHLSELGEGRKMTKRINEYGLYSVFGDLHNYLTENAKDFENKHFEIFVEITKLFMETTYH